MLPVDTAAAAHSAAHTREAREGDTLLVVDHTVSPAENRIEPFSTFKLKDEGLIALIHAIPARQPGGPGAQTASRCYLAQDAAKPTIVKVDRRLS